MRCSGEGSQWQWGRARPDMGRTTAINHRGTILSGRATLKRCIRAGITCLALILPQIPGAAHAVSLAYVTNAGSGNVSVINATTNTVATTITVGLTPEQIAVTPNGTFAYVANSGSNTVSVISTFTNTVTATVPVGTGPAGVAITPNGAFAYVANFVSNTVSVIATASNTVAATVPVGANPTGVAITPSDVPIIPTLSDGAVLLLFAAMAAALAMRICARPVSRPRRPPHAI